eukprot:TRINITY_DN12293_c0_g1_i1.p1 TRINITY_DN12293_c0_g1~~TRINITY_DN12293_c0_g1_i1.p1  ORF type:complete len:122 (+),score=26.57 TRINITY_DN12293_c0_g1_i1:511-876(+)
MITLFQVLEELAQASFELGLSSLNAFVRSLPEIQVSFQKSKRQLVFYWVVTLRGSLRSKPMIQFPNVVASHSLSSILEFSTILLGYFAPLSTGTAFTKKHTWLCAKLNKFSPHNFRVPFYL